jgi:hypothetical protein
MSNKAVRIDLNEEPSAGIDDDGEPLPPRLWVRFRIEDADGLFSIRERSLGFRWFFVYLLITTYRGRRKSAANDILFLFDEPASNLHQSAQQALLTSLEELAKQATIIYTTHSHHLIEPAWLGTTFVVANEGQPPDALSPDYTAERTDIVVTPYRQFAANHPNQAHFFQPILDVLDYAPSRLELVPNMVMVEGKSDFYLLEYYQSVAAPSETRLAITPGGGAGTLDDLIQLYIGWARPFVVLLDSDRTGLTQKRRYLDKFGPLLEPHLVDLATASGRKSAKGIESLLADSDKLKLQRIMDPSSRAYNKKLLALGVQEALIRREVVNFTQATNRALAKVVLTLGTMLNDAAERLAGDGV